MVKEQRMIATVEEAQSQPSERNYARVSNQSSSSIAHTLQRHLTKHQWLWLSSFDRLAPYSLWIGVVFVFAGIVVRDRNWSRRRTGLD